MDIREYDLGQYQDIFGDTNKQGQQKSGVSFGRSEEGSTDILSVSQETTQDSTTGETTQDSTTGETTQSTTQETTEKPADADILGGEKDKPQAGRKPKYDFSDMSGYYEDRVKNGKFVQIEEETEGGKKLFIPKTPEDFDEVIDIQVDHKYQQKVKDIENSWYQTKSPAWQAVARYAEMVDDPSEVLPFIQGVRNFNSVANVDENEIDGAEQIVRARLEQRGDPKEVIDTQIESLKTADKLINTAKQYKPIILQEEQRNLQQMVQDRKREEQERDRIVETVRLGAMKAIEAPLFGKQKLKQEEKAAVYQLIAEPSEETQGYPIYNAIDALFEKGDFETLRKVALLLTKEESFINYISTSAADKTAADLQRKLRAVNDSRTAGSDADAGDSVVVQRNQYKNSVPRFGR